MAGTKVADLYAALALDLKGYHAGLKQAETEGNQFTQTLGQRLKAAFTQTSLGGLVQDLQLGRNKTTAFRDAAKSLGSELKSLTVAGLHSGLNSVKSVLGSVKNAVTGLAREIGRGFLIGTGIGAFFSLQNVISDLIHAIPDLIDKGRAYGQLVDDISDSTGAAAAESSKLAAALQYLGAPTGSIMSLMGQMAQHLTTIEPKLKAMGVATRDLNGVQLNQVQILFNMREAFSKYADGAQKAALIQDLARSGLKTFADFLQISDAQWVKYVADWKAQGLILTEAQRNLAEDAGREGNRLANAFAGLGTQLFALVAPEINRFLSWFSEQVSAHATEIAAFIGSIVSTIAGLIQGLTGWGGSMNSFTASVRENVPVASAAEMQLAALESELAALDENATSATGSTKDLTSAIDSQSEAIDRETAAIRAKGEAFATVLRRTLQGYAAEYAAQLQTLDASERKLAIDRQREDIAEQLNEAAQAVAEAQQPDEKGVVSAQAISAALQRQADLKARLAEFDRQQVVEGNRDRLQGEIDFYAALEKLAESENKKALAKNLASRRAILESRLTAAQAGGDTGTVADLTKRIEAIKAVEAETQKAIGIGTELDLLAKRKKALEEEKQAIQASASAATDGAATQRAAIQTQIDALEKLVQKEKTDDAARRARFDFIAKRTGEVFGTQPTGLTGAMEEARLKGVQMGNDIRDILVGRDGKGGLLGAVASVIGKIGELGSAFNDPYVRMALAAVLGAAVGGPLGAAAFAIIAGVTTPEFQTGLESALGQHPSTEATQKTIDDYIKRNYPQYLPAPSTGGGGVKRLQSGSWRTSEGFAYLHNDEMVLRPSIAAAIRAGFGQRLDSFQPWLRSDSGKGTTPHGHDIYLDGRKVGEAVAPTVSGELARLVRR